MAQLPHEEQLQKLFSNINDWLKFAEAKNFGLLTLNAALVFGITQIEFSEASALRTVAYYIFIPFSLISFLLPLISLFPILSKIEKGSMVKSSISILSNWIDKEQKFENIHFYGYLRGLSEIEFESKFFNKIGATGTFSQYEKELVTQILYNSRITWLKYQLFKIGAFVFLLGIVVCVILLPIIRACN